MSSHGILFRINPQLYLRNPQLTDYGKKLLSNSILLMDDIGFEAFTFKKLAKQINSTETSIYRYFGNKHILLLFLSNWYWEWVNYLIDLNLMNITDPKKKLKLAIHNIVNAGTESPLTEYINEEKLHHLIINESSKGYHVHTIDQENKNGYFEGLQRLVDKVSKIIKAAAPNFPYPKILASNLFEMANNQIYFAEHLPKMTDIKNRKKKFENLEEAMNYMVFKLIGEDQKTQNTI